MTATTIKELALDSYNFCFQDYPRTYRVIRFLISILEEGGDLELKEFLQNCLGQSCDPRANDIFDEEIWQKLVHSPDPDPDPDPDSAARELSQESMVKIQKFRIFLELAPDFFEHISHNNKGGYTP